jgi:polyhydroxyalkanoate synthesis regulator phasin
MISFQKTLFENSFNAMVMVQEQTEKMIDTFLTKLPWLPEEGKKAVNDSVAFYKKSRDDYKNAVDDGFSKLESLFTEKQ